MRVDRRQWIASGAIGGVVTSNPSIAVFANGNFVVSYQQLSGGDTDVIAWTNSTIDLLVDLIVEVQTVRTCQTAAELDPDRSSDGFAVPGRAHVAAGSIAMQKSRQRIAEILRILPGSSLVVAPSDKDLAAPEIAAGLAESFGGGGYTALERAALLQLASDHVSSALDGRESAFELHANGGIVAWRGRLLRCFDRYNELANGVLRAIDLDMPQIDLSHLRAIPLRERRQVAPSPSGSGGPAGAESTRRLTS